MALVRPAWWCYPERCANGHEWGPGLITVSWSLCDCGPAVAASGGGAPGHLAVYCAAPLTRGAVSWGATERLTPAGVWERVRAASGIRRRRRADHAGSTLSQRQN